MNGLPLKPDLQPVPQTQCPRRVPSSAPRCPVAPGASASQPWVGRGLYCGLPGVGRGLYSVPGVMTAPYICYSFILQSRLSFFLANPLLL